MGAGQEEWYRHKSISLSQEGTSEQQGSPDAKDGHVLNREKNDCVKGKTDY